MEFFQLQAVLLQAVDTTASVVSNQESISLFDLLKKGGWFMIPIFLLFFIAVILFVDRYIAISKARKINMGFMQTVKDYMIGGNRDAAIAVCQQENTPVSRMVEKGLKRLGKPIESIENSIENVGKLELLQLEKRLPIIATIAGVAPMIGFLGTVTGMIRAFFNLSKAGTNIDPGLLAGGIYEAMLTTAAGLAVGIVAYIFYNILVAMIQRVVYKMQSTTTTFMDVLQEPA